MALGCASKTAKIFLIFFNIILTILGVCVLGVGIWILTDTSFLVKLAAKSLGSDGGDQTNFGQTVIETVAYILIAVGLFTLITGVSGFVGAIKESMCLMCFYTALVILIVILEIVCAGLAGGFQAKAKEKLKTGLKETLNNQYVGMPYSQQLNSPVSMAWDWMMIKFNCCGVDGIDDFIQHYNTTAHKWYYGYRNYTACVPMNEIITKFKAGWNPTNITGMMTIPAACCRYNDKRFIADADWAAYAAHMVDKECPLTKKHANLVGCFDKVQDEIHRRTIAIIVAASVVVVVEVIVIVAAIILILAIKSSVSEVAKS